MNQAVIVVPCYNEAERLDAGAFRRHAAEGHPHRFLFVNDGSTDATLDVLRSLFREDPARFAVEDLPRNSGKAEAVRRGVLRALDEGADLVGFWDADLATPLEVIPEFRRLFEADPDVQIVLGSRVRLLGRNIQRRAARHYLGRGFATVASLVLGLPVYDTQCGAKLLRASDEVRRLFAEPFRSRWIFDVELLARLIRHRKAAGALPLEQGICELPLPEWREVGGSKLKPRDFVRALFDLASIYRDCLRPAAVARARAALAADGAAPPTAPRRRRAA
jgi:dolichyl-phosphate beta-glucosyltransferase